MKRTNPFPAEVRDRAVRLVAQHRSEYRSEWAALESIVAKIGCAAMTLRNWVRQREINEGKRVGLSTDERDRLKQLERESLELNRANEILRKASAYFA